MTKYYVAIHFKHKEKLEFEYETREEAYNEAQMFVLDTRKFFVIKEKYFIKPESIAYTEIVERETGLQFSDEVLAKNTAEDFM